MNPVLILTHNNLKLTQKCVNSALTQDIPTAVYVYDNGSSDGTLEWLEYCAKIVGKSVAYTSLGSNVGVSAGWNKGLSHLFSFLNFEHVLVVNNDTILPPWFYSELLSYQFEIPVGRFIQDARKVNFVTGVSVDNMEAIESRPLRNILVPHPDFSAFLIRREAWDKVGPFDEAMIHYASDNDWHVRAHRAGVPLMNSGVPFYHERSSTLRLADPEEQRAIQLQADADRQVFKTKYGCMPWEPGYAKLFED